MIKNGCFVFEMSDLPMIQSLMAVWDSEEDAERVQGYMSRLWEWVTPWQTGYVEH